MKVAEIVATFPPYHGGMGYVCLHNSTELIRRGHDVTVFTLDHGGLNYNDSAYNMKVVRLRSPLKYGDSGIVPHLYLKLKGFDIVHLHYPFFGGAEYVYVSSLLRGQKYFLTYHLDVYGDTPLKNLVIYTYEACLMKKIIGRAAGIGALSIEHLKSSKIAAYVDWNKVVEIPNGVDGRRFSPREKKPELIKQYGLENKVIVLFVGNLQPFKGFHILIEAVFRIKDKQIAALVVGDGYEINKYKKQVNNLGLEDRIIFAGAKSHEDLPYYYNMADFLVLPSTYSESFGLVVLEAMASEKPAIVSALPGPSFLINDGIDGLIVQPGDAEDLKNKILFMAQNKELCRSMGERGRQKVLQKYSMEKVGESLERAFRNILK